MVSTDQQTAWLTPCWTYFDHCLRWGRDFPARFPKELKLMLQRKQEMINPAAISIGTHTYKTQVRK